MLLVVVQSTHTTVYHGISILHRILYCMCISMVLLLYVIW